MRLIPRIQTGATLRAIFLGAALATAFPAIADNLPEVQKLIKQGQYPQALTKVDAFLATKPKDAQGRFLKGLILTEMNKPADAIAVFTKLTEDYPELPEPYNNLAVLYAQQKQYDKSRTALEMAIRTHPAYAIAYENLGDVYAKLASQAYDKALQIDSSNSAAQNKLALIRDLISTSGKPGVKPQLPVARTEPKPEPVKVAAATPAPVAAPAPTPAPAPAKPAAAAVVPNATVISTVPPTTVAPAKPVPAPVAAPAAAKPTDSSHDDIAKAVTGWAAAWSRKDVKAYLAHYSGDFKPPKGMTRKAWEAQREDRIAGKGGKISVTIDEPKISATGDKATVKFRQYYKAGSLATSTNKTLVMVRSGGKWLIQDEDSH